MKLRLCSFIQAMVLSSLLLTVGPTTDARATTAPATCSLPDPDESIHAETTTPAPAEATTPAPADTIPDEAAPAASQDSLVLGATLLVVDDPEAVRAPYGDVYLKTNALALGLIIANAAVEVDVHPRWSMTLPVYYSAWDYFKHTLKFRTFSVFPELRYWPRAGHEGWFVNAHLGLVWYNVALDGSLRTQDRNGGSPAYGGGLGFGYRKPLGRNSRWSIEFAFGAGAYGLYYDQWHNERNGLRYHTRRRAYVGPDQAAVTIVYRIYNKKRR